MGEWKFSLVKSMEDPVLQVYTDDKIVIIKDKYPKSEYHYLVLPKENISGIRLLNSSHLSILKYMDTKAREFLREHYEGLVFWLGYHAVPSLQRLHLHLISDDFKSTALKTAKHWNSFTTHFFLPSSNVQSLLKRMATYSWKCNISTFTKPENTTVVE
ncbi:aprataxin isoform X2 [Lycorma delicatula]|uniref:aprataxin isoform X2 n=1 Tax=Lycorma delicatula TaxID=130591 RepID=UPI003F510128